jgi:phosphoribosyl 1,2-cyclic phosphodiesterase
MLGVIRSAFMDELHVITCGGPAAEAAMGVAHAPQRPLRPPAHTIAALRVLASGSAANSSVLVYGDPASPLKRACLIDLGLSPRKTTRLLAESGIRMDQVDDVILTHLDADHIHPGWLVEPRSSAGRASPIPGHARVRVHHGHVREAVTRGLGVVVRPSGDACPDVGGGGPARLVPFDGAFALDDGIRVHSLLNPHDELGAASFRFSFDVCGASLGFATDVGCITADLIDQLHGVDVLAIESNYCPKLQDASTRPDFLKRRITGGSGHLSNQQCVQAIQHIEPRMHVVLLHLSRECNHPDVVAPLHEGADYALTIASQEAPTRWVQVALPSSFVASTHSSHIRTSRAELAPTQ